jgi:hypothetical protein
MKTMRDEGNTYKKIANHLNAQELTAKQGSKWFSKTVRSIIIV